MSANPYRSPDETATTNPEPTKTAKHQRSSVEKVVLWASIAGTAHFATSLSIWLVWVYVRIRLGEVDWNSFRYALPTVVLLPVFATASLKAWRRTRGASLLLLLACALSVAAFAFDATYRNWQLHVENYEGKDIGPTFRYFNWWWYDERWL